jgi:hypothetical protein
MNQPNPSNKAFGIPLNSEVIGALLLFTLAVALQFFLNVGFLVARLKAEDSTEAIIGISLFVVVCIVISIWIGKHSKGWFIYYFFTGIIPGMIYESAWRRLQLGLKKG